ncbi:MAG: hypothetical protein ABGZ53_22970 [Fuerstiella sp.]
MTRNERNGPNVCFRKLGRLHAVTMRTREYRYIRWQKDLGRGKIIFQELYDHRTDPEEQNNLAESSLEIVERLSEQLAKHQDNKKAVK